MKVLIPEKKTIQWKMSKELFKLINEKISLNEEK